MAVIDQPKYSYSDADTHIRSVSDFISLVDPRDTPLLMRIGMDTAGSKLRIGFNNTKLEWFEDALNPLASTANQGTTITTNTLTITVADGSIFQAGHVVQVAGVEKVIVVSVASEVLTVVRGWGSTTGTTAAATAALSIIGMARLEGQDATYGPLTNITVPYNYTQIFQKGVQITGTQMAMSQYGQIEGELAYQFDKAVAEQARDIERMIFHGERVAGSAGDPRRGMGGLPTYVTQTSGITTTVTKAVIDEAARDIYIESSRFPDLLVMHPNGATNLRNLLDSSNFVRVQQENSRFGMDAIEKIVTQYGTMELVSSRHCPTNRAYILNSEMIGGYAYRPQERHEIAKTGDSAKGELITEWSMAVANGAEAHMEIQTTGTTL